MKKYQEAIERRKSKPFTFALNKDKLWGVFMFSVASFIILLFIKFMMRIEEEMLYDYEQLKIRRYGNAPRSVEENVFKDKSRIEFREKI